MIRVIDIVDETKKSIGKKLIVDDDLNVIYYPLELDILPGEYNREDFFKELKK